MMAKGQLRSARELRQPKAKTPKKQNANPSTKLLGICST